jgi:5-methylcytosine-specific restriction endonuclease McrA
MRSCIVCDKSYTNPGKKCNSCRNKLWKEANREKDLAQRSAYNKRRWQKLKPEVVDKRCLYCGKLFTPNSRHRNTQEFCSLVCRTAQYRKDNRPKILEQKHQERLRHKAHYAETNAVYKDKLRFSGNRLRALSRDDFTCQKCGYEGEGLNVHHIDFSGQTPKPNNRIENLVTLCRACHIRSHTHLLRT